jgi:hypothetical protein
MRSLGMNSTVTRDELRESDSVRPVMRPGLISAKLGRCARCMRLSLLGAGFGWGVVMASRFLRPDPWLRDVLLFWALCFSALWLAHVVAFSGRLLKRARAAIVVEHNNYSSVPVQTLDDRTLTIPSPERPAAVGRRRFVRVLFEGAALAILASLPPLRTSWAAACNACPGNSTCRSSGNSCTNCCCPDGYPYLSYCDCICYEASPDCSSYAYCR